MPDRIDHSHPSIELAAPRLGFSPAGIVMKRMTASRHIQRLATGRKSPWNLRSALAVTYLVTISLLFLAGMYAHFHAGIDLPKFILRTIPADPRELVHGDSMLLCYEIGQLPAASEKFKEGQRVYVTLLPDRIYHRRAQVLSHQPAGDVPWIRGTYRRGRIEFGIEKLLVPPGQAIPPPPITVEVAVRPGGSAQIAKVWAQDRPWPPKD
jgi:uncharacterized membrane-anchored protein